MTKENIIIYIHGKGGNAQEAQNYQRYFPETKIYGFNYKSNYPWDAKEEFHKEVSKLSNDYNNIILIANSLGAYFSLVSGIDKFISKAFLISPIVDMERLILDMINWAGTTEAELEQKKTIPVDFGDDLSWEYLQYVRTNKIQWNVPTEVLYGNLDNLQSIETIKKFVHDTDANLTVMEGGEHWFHTEKQLKFLDEWFSKLC